MDFETFACEHRRPLPGGDVAFYKGNRAAREKDATYAEVRTYAPQGGCAFLHVKLDDAGKDLLRRLEMLMDGSFAAGKREQQRATLEVLGVKQ